MDVIVAQAINVLYAVVTLAVLCLGLAVIFGLLGVLNLAHGEFVMVGAYSAFVAQEHGWPFLCAVPMALAACAVLGYIVERGLIRPLYQRPFDTLVATWGLSLLLRKGIEALFGLSYRTVDSPFPGTTRIFVVEYPTYRLVLIGICITGLTGLTLWYARSRAALRIRAMVANSELAAAFGMSVTALASRTFVVGTCLAGLGGVMIAPLVPLNPYMGLDYVLQSFFVLVVGGLGSVLGLFAGATIVGGIGSAVAAASNGTSGYVTVILIAIAFLWLRPTGIFARR